jgi:hypothetical protein
VFLTVLFTIVAGVGYGAYTLVAGPSYRPAAPPLLPLLEVIGGEPETVDGLLGPPTSVIPIENVPENMPGEFRDYSPQGLPDPVSVRFYRGRAVFITVLLPQGERSAEEALLRVGIGVGETQPSTVAPGATWWRAAQLEGKTLERVGALRGMNGSDDLFDMVQVEAR